MFDGQTHGGRTDTSTDRLTEPESLEMFDGQTQVRWTDFWREVFGGRDIMMLWCGGGHSTGSLRRKQ